MVQYNAPMWIIALQNGSKGNGICVEAGSVKAGSREPHLRGAEVLMSLRIVSARPIGGCHAASRVLAVAVLAMVWAIAPAAWAVIPSDALLQRLQPHGYVNDYAGVLKPANAGTGEPHH